MKPLLKSTIPIVKLFPRLAPPRFISAPVRAERAGIRMLKSKAAPPLPADRTQVRAWLLRMILENERARRNECRPSAS
jgi:hypothetical protein